MVSKDTEVELSPCLIPKVLPESTNSGAYRRKIYLILTHFRCPDLALTSHSKQRNRTPRECYLIFHPWKPAEFQVDCEYQGRMMEEPHQSAAIPLSVTGNAVSILLIPASTDLLNWPTHKLLTCDSVKMGERVKVMPTKCSLDFHFQVGCEPSNHNLKQ